MFSDSPTTKPSLLKRKTMSLTQTYYLAHSARGKLSAEAARADHNLRLLVGHANLLDSLMLDLASAEQEQESWFNQSVRSATKSNESSRQHIQWADAAVEDPEEDWDANDADSSDSDDSDYDEDEYVSEASFTTLYRTQSHPIEATSSIRSIPEEEEEDFEDDGAEDYAALSLTPSPSHSASPPELSHDSDSESEDDSMPPSPPSDALPSFSEKQQTATTSFYTSSSPQSLSPAEQASFLNEGYFIPSRSPPNLVSAISVY